MAHHYISGKTFVEALANTAPKRAAPLKVKRGFGTNDTRLDQRRLASRVDEAQMTAMNHLSRKAAIDSVSNLANLYMIEDTKSRAGTSYQQDDYIVVTREEVSLDAHEQYGMIARR